jgi:hypothetical protein
MVKVVFVGDEPSKTNVHNDIAFVGAKCFQRLTEWINYLSPDYYICLNSHTDYDMVKIMSLYEQGFKVIALGAKASERLLEHGVSNFKLPHPSGLNRQLNDKKVVEGHLDACLSWLKDYPVSGAV